MLDERAHATPDVARAPGAPWCADGIRNSSRDRMLERVREDASVKLIRYSELLEKRGLTRFALVVPDKLAVRHD
jgi:hypothetical protein